MAEYGTYQECNSNPRIVDAALHGIHESFITDALRFNVKAVLPLVLSQSQPIAELT